VQHLWRDYPILINRQPAGIVKTSGSAGSGPPENELLVWIIRTAAAGDLARGPAEDHTRWYADHPGHGCPTASTPEATSDNGVARIGLMPASGDGPQVPARGPGADQESGPGRGFAPDHADQDTDQIRGDSGRADTGHDESETNAAAVAAYRASLQAGRPLSERKLAGTFGKTSRRWARYRIAEARQASILA
jgi:hypothetical protein